MKKRILSLFVVLLISVTGCYTQSFVTVRGTNDISENLNLEAVATLFGESRNLEDFEAMLNDPRNQISNLDLNHDGYVDYLRVIESYENGVYLITLQDVLGNNLYQDVATINVSRNGQGYPQVAVVGDPYFYGPNYVIEPIYDTRPLIFSIFWNPGYRLWVSPYYWNYYPHFFHPWRIFALFQYRRHIHSFVRPPKYYRYLHAGGHGEPMIFHNKAARNDYEKMHPGSSFLHRNQGYKNARDLYQKRNSSNHNVRPSNVQQQRPAQNHNVKSAPVKVKKIKSSPVRVNKTPAKYKSAPVKPTIKKPSGKRQGKTYRKKDKSVKTKAKIKRNTKVSKEKPKDHHGEEKKKDKKR